MPIDTSFLHQLDKFDLIIRKRVTSTLIGQRKSSALGKGLIFKDHRIYAPGDDFRGIDWKVYARTDDFFIKNYEEERNLAVHILLDSSSSMDFGKHTTKYEYGAMLALGFSYLAMKGNEKVQFSNFAEDIEIFKPDRGISQIVSMLQHLNKQKPAGTTFIDKCFAHYKKAIGSKSIVVVISDFLIDIESIKSALISLAGQQMKVIQVLDPAEKELRFEGDHEFEDSETKARLKSYVTPRLRDHFQKELDMHSGKIHEICTTLGAEFYQITTNKQLFDAFYDMVK